MVFGEATCDCYISIYDKEKVNKSKKLILTDFKNAICVGFTADVRELGYQVLRGAPVMISDRYRALNMPRSFLELEEHNARHRDISRIRKVERDVE